ncbi:hypothetical protein NC661_05225 [Aquibacillus koreensis]|uniref:Capsule biosynthesis protein CapK n=1 Tax=Aquibacillus koreensis TaxID=279446 RepID=A0A9X4AH54_9BACI|nr:hypothetical protein [Aquibacillus koreensis]MCT2535124.1 hypothetical protein [Aquibacillus koreensis]MDC3419767.1 hypothetical protein [Aquibacillus koreensis]
MLSKIVFLAGTRIRNKEITNSLRFLKQSDRWSIAQLEQYQLEKCKELLEWAYNKSTFYRNKCEEKNVHPDDLKTLADLVCFPTVSKQEVLTYTKDIQIKEGFDKLFFSETSGSTGQPLVFYRNKQWDARHRAAMFRGYSWYGVKPWEKNGYFWGYNIAKDKQRKVKLLDFLVNRFRLFSYKQEDIEAFVKKLKHASYLEGYSSMIYEVAKMINDKGLHQKIDLKMIKGTSEKILDKYQEEVEKAFGKKMISEYGAAEAGIIGFECPEGKMHITMENVIVEEEDGEIIVTNLMSKSFPIIRYRLGDYIKLNKETTCACGREHYVIEDIIGRVGSTIKGHTTNYPSMVFYYVFKNLAMTDQLVLNYQAHQHQVGKVLVYVEQKLSPDKMHVLQQEFKKYFKDDVDVDIQDQHPIERLNGKMKDFISNLE